ncbi:hemolysin family protein [Planctomycetota bacterium]
MGNIFLIVLLVCFLAGVALFFSVNTISLRTVSRGRLIEAFKASNKEELADKLLDDKEKLVVACAFYRLILNMVIFLLLLFAFAGLDSAAQIHDYVFSFVCAVVIFLVFSLVIPDAWAKYAGEKVLSRTYKLLPVFAAIVFPVLYLRKLTGGLVRRLAGVPEATPEEEQEEKQEEFLTGLEKAGIVDAEEQEMIENVLELADTTADEIMTPRTDLVAIEINSNRRNVLETITKAGHSRIPVYEENIDKIVGLVYAKDLLSEIDKDEADFRLRDKIREAYFVPETKHLRELLHEFQNQKLHAAIVLDEYGGTAGIVTIEDILEELVGEITDEYEKTPIKPIRKTGDNIFEADARTRIDDVNDELDIKVPEEEDYDTIGGFVFSHLGYIPKTGESFDYKGIQFTISSAEARRIKRIRIKLASKD